MYSHDDDLIDFPVSDVWRDHYAARGMTYASGRYSKKSPAIPPTPRGGHSEADGSGWTTVQELLAALKQKQAEIDRRKQPPPSQADSRDSFEGVE